MRDKYHLRRAKGICAVCPAPVDGEFWKCRACRLRQAADTQRRRPSRAKPPQTTEAGSHG